jgi:F-type H+-transporting ATPase subunit b
MGVGMRLSRFLLPLAAGGVQAGGGTFGRVLSEFHVEWPLLLAQSLNFLIVAYVLHRFALRPLLEAAERRQKKIADGLQYAEEMREQLAQLEADRTRTLQEAAEQASGVMEEARSSAKNYAEAERRRTAEELETLRRRERERLGQEEAETFARVRGKLKREAAALAEKILSQELGADAPRRAKVADGAAKAIAGTGTPRSRTKKA